MVARTSIVVASIATLVFSTSAYSQSTPDSAPKVDQQAEMHCPMHGQGMHGGSGRHHGKGMRGEHGMHGQRGMMGDMKFPPGYEKLEMQMHAEMMDSMSRILKKYAAQLPDKR